MNFPNQFEIYQNGIESGNLVSNFRKKTERINWKLLAAVDVDRIIQQNDIRVLSDNIKHLTFCDIENEIDIRDCDKSLVKMFKLSQLMIDYLLTSQEFLASAHNSAEERAQVMSEETEAAKRKLQENESYISDIKRECHRRKKLILAQQQIMDSGPNAYHRCPYCEKAFLTGTFLQAHLEKRHADRYIKDWYLIENQRKKSPKREHSEEPPVQKDKTLELILQKLMEQRQSSPVPQKNYDDDLRRMANEFERERREWQLQMRQLEDEIDELRHLLKLANKKPRSHLQNLEDDLDYSDQGNMERARQKAIEDHKKNKPIIIPVKRVKKPKTKIDEKPSIDDRINQQTNVNEGQFGRYCTDDAINLPLKKAFGMSRLSRRMDSIYSIQSKLVSASKMDELENISLSANQTHETRDESNNNDDKPLDESPEFSINSINTSAYTESLTLSFQSSSSNSSSASCGRKILIQPPAPEKPQPEKRKVESPIHLSPRQTSTSPVLRNSNDKELPVRESFKRKSSIVFDDLDNLDNLGIDFTQDLIEKFCNEVRHMLDDHLELHGIQRGTTGIPGSVLNDKIKIMDHEESQLKLKYPNYADIRKRLEKEVDREAARRIAEGTVKPMSTKPSLDNKIPERIKPQLSSRSLQSSQSEWDDISDPKPFTHKQGSPVRTAPQNLQNEHKKVIEQHNRNRSASQSPTRKNNIRHSSDLSNTLDSSAWPTESKAVTSVAHHSQVPKPTQTNRSSDYDDESTFSR